VVKSRYRFDGQSSDGDPLADGELVHVMPGGANERPEPGRHDDPRPAADPEKRGKVQVVVMRMGDEDRVDVDVGLVDAADVPVKRAEPVDEERIREDAHAVELEEDRRMSEKAQVGPRMRHVSSLIGDSG
jgi:hypothetical protein